MRSQDPESAMTPYEVLCGSNKVCPYSSLSGTNSHGSVKQEGHCNGLLWGSRSSGWKVPLKQIYFPSWSET